MNIPMQPNPFQDSYLLRMHVKKNPPSTAEQQNAVVSGPPVTEDYIKHNQRKKTLLDHKNLVTAQRNGGANQRLQILNQRRDEVAELHKQLLDTKNPFERQQLEASLSYKSSGTTGLKHNIASSYDGPGGGFVGSENRIDYIGSFATFG